MRIFNRLLAQIQACLRRWFTRPYRTRIVEGTLPVQLKPKTIYVVQDDDYPEYAAMICPCGCNQMLYMNLIPDERPCWHLTRHSDGTMSLHPSVWRKKGCKSHFWFRQGQIDWCNDT